MTADLLTRVPITFATADGGTTHAPLIVVSVGRAAPARYVLDTGSEVHLLNEDLADELGLDKVPGEEGVDHSGATMPSWSVGNVAIDLGGLSETLRECVSIPAPAVFAPRGIRGILSPQAFHPSAWTVIDLVADELLLVDGSASDLADFLSARSPALGLLRLARDASFPSLVVPAALDGYSEIPTLLNTGGKSTEYSASAVPGLTSEGEERLGGGVSGADVVGWSIGAHTLIAGGRRITLPKLSIRPQMHDPQAIVGMDALRGTVLAMTADLARPVLWQVPI